MISTFEKPGDWQGTKVQRQKVLLSYHSGFADDVSLIEITSDICHVIMRVYQCDGYTGKVENMVLQQIMSDRCIDELIQSLQRAKDHRHKMDDVWRDNGKKWLSSNGGDHPGPEEEQNRIYELPWEEVK